MGPTTLSPGRSLDLLDEVVSGGLGREIHLRLQRRFPRVSRDDIDDAYQAAYLATRNSATLRGTTAAEIGRYLTVAAERRLFMAARRRRHETPEGEEALATAMGEDDTADPVDDLDAEIDLGPVVHEITAKLNERERDVLALYCSDARRKDIARELRISEKAAKKDLEAILAKGRNLLVGKAGGGCDDGRELVVALAFGLLRDPRGLAGAQTHLLDCAACSGLYERLEMFRDAAAAILPLPAGDVATNAGMMERASQKLADAASAAKQQLADATAQTKVHATNVYTRAADPTPLAGARPGTAGAVLASCIAVGSGAAYCTQQGLDPIRSLAGAKTEQADKTPKPKPRKAQAETSPPPPVIPTPPPAPTTTTPAPTPAPAPAAPAPTPTPTPAVDPAQQGGSARQFDPGAAASPAQAAPTPQPSQPSAPAPASGGEFSGP